MYTKGIGYVVQMLLHPQTLYGIADSPAGLAAWIADHDAQSYLDITSAFVDGQPVGNLTRDEVLDNITLTWLGNTGVSSARLYHENAFGFFDAKGVSVPAAVTVFPKELFQAPRSWAERAYPQPDLFPRSGPRRALRGMAGAAAVLRGGSRRFPLASLSTRVRACAYAPTWRVDRVAQLRATRLACLRGHVVLVNFSTLTGSNWLRQGPHLGLVACLPGRQVDRDRGPHPGVLLRAQDRRHPAGDRGARHRLPARAGPRL